MPFNTPTFNKLNLTALTLKKIYEEEKINGTPHFLMAWFSAPPNPERLEDINFIIKLAKNIDENKVYYHQMDNEYYRQDYHRVILPFLTNVLAGALLYILSKISRSYFLESSVKDRSALGRILLTTFDINALSEAPIDERKLYLNALKQYMKVVDKDLFMQGKTETWHTTLTNPKLYEDITLTIEACSSANWTPAALFS